MTSVYKCLHNLKMWGKCQMYKKNSSNEQKNSLNDKKNSLNEQKNSSKYLFCIISGYC